MTGATGVVSDNDRTIEIDGTEYLLIGDPGDEHQLQLYKHREMLAAYEPIIEEFQGAAIVELGVFRGGSTAYFAQRCAPRALIAFERSPERIDPLDRFIAARHLQDTVQVHHGVDQADRATVARLVDAALGDDPIDLVIDDASHRYGPTVASFEVLFPRLRPGGLYVIEDWRSEEWFIGILVRVLDSGDRAVLADIEDRMAAELDAGEPGSGGAGFLRYCTRVLADDTVADHATIAAWYESMRGPGGSEAGARIATRITESLEAHRAGTVVPPTSATLGTLAAELLLGLKTSHPGIGEVTVNEWWISVRRGPAELDPSSFSIADLSIDHFGLLAPHDRGR